MQSLDVLDLCDDFAVSKVTRRPDANGGGTWVCGTVAGFRFEALVFREHAESESCELNRSRISKLWLLRSEPRHVAASFDRGWDVRPTTDAAAGVVEFLCSGLADLVCGVGNV